jgi:hypothetical protein
MLNDSSVLFPSLTAVVGVITCNLRVANTAIKAFAYEKQ